MLGCQKQGNCWKRHAIGQLKAWCGWSTNLSLSISLSGTFFCVTATTSGPIPWADQRPIKNSALFICEWVKNAVLTLFTDARWAFLTFVLADPVRNLPKIFSSTKMEEFESLRTFRSLQPATPSTGGPANLLKHPRAGRYHLLAEKLRSYSDSSSQPETCDAVTPRGNIPFTLWNDKNVKDFASTGWQNMTKW